MKNDRKKGIWQYTGFNHTINRRGITWGIYIFLLLFCVYYSEHVWNLVLLVELKIQSFLWHVQIAIENSHLSSAGDG